MSRILAIPAGKQPSDARVRTGQRTFILWIIGADGNDRRYLKCSGTHGGSRRTAAAELRARRKIDQPSSSRTGDARRAGAVCFLPDAESRAAAKGEKIGRSARD